jgi:protocatechuate 3,4-dioxygenase beta subunit
MVYAASSNTDPHAAHNSKDPLFGQGRQVMQHTDRVASRSDANSERGHLRRTPDQILGPFFPVERPPSRGRDLIVLEARKHRPFGQIIEISGRVLNLDGEPVAGAPIIIWQANSFGRYAHPNDVNPAPLDPNFVGFTEIESNHAGTYRLRTVKPGAYPTSSGSVRAPHIHFEVHGVFERLVTQMYFPGEPLNASDRFLMSVTQPELLIATSAKRSRGQRSAVFTFDIILCRG